MYVYINIIVQNDTSLLYYIYYTNNMNFLFDVV